MVKRILQKSSLAMNYKEKSVVGDSTKNKNHIRCDTMEQMNMILSRRSKKKSLTVLCQKSEPT